MGYEEENDCYQRLSKKELQDLCKRHGLSPYMKKANLVNSLQSYFKASNCTEVECSKSQFNDNGGNSHLTCNDLETVNSQNALQCNGTDLESEGKSRKVCSCKINVTFGSEEVGKSNGPQTRSRTKDDGLAKGDKTARSFEFFASSDEGISLTVDLNPISSDWSKTLNSFVCCCHCLHSNKVPTLREELELLANRRKQKDLSPTNADFEHEKNKHLQGSSYSDKGECTMNTEKASHEQDEIHVNSGTVSCPISIETDDHVREEENVEIHVNTGTEYCPINIETDSSGKDDISSPQTNLSSDSVFYSASENLNSLDLLEHQNSAASERFGDESLQNNITPMATNLAGNGSSRSIMIRSPDVVNAHKDGLGSVRRSDRLRQVADATVSKESPAFTKEMERRQVRDEAKPSGSFQSPEATQIVSEGGGKVVKRTRQSSEVINLNYNSFPNVKVLRSHKHLLGPRRSPRITK